ncbi:MAG: hypothetical protein ABH865_05840 [Candidatus Omnitrophota bacterium]
MIQVSIFDINSTIIIIAYGGKKIKISPYLGLENIKSNTGEYIPSSEEKEGFGTSSGVIDWVISICMVSIL